MIPSPKIFGRVDEISDIESPCFLSPSMYMLEPVLLIHSEANASMLLLSLVLFLSETSWPQSHSLSPSPLSLALSNRSFTSTYVCTHAFLPGFILDPVTPFTYHFFPLTAKKTVFSAIFMFSGGVTSQFIAVWLLPPPIDHPSFLRISEPHFCATDPFDRLMKPMDCSEYCP